MASSFKVGGLERIWLKSINIFTSDKMSEMRVRSYILTSKCSLHRRVSDENRIPCYFSPAPTNCISCSVIDQGSQELLIWRWAGSPSCDLVFFERLIMCSYEKWVSPPIAVIPPRWDKNFLYEQAQVGQPGNVG